MIRVFPTHVPVSERRHVQVRRDLLDADGAVQAACGTGGRPFGGEFRSCRAEGGLFVGFAAGEEGAEAGWLGVPGGGGAAGVGDDLLDGGGGCGEGSVKRESACRERGLREGRTAMKRCVRCRMSSGQRMSFCMYVWEGGGLTPSLTNSSLRCRRSPTTSRRSIDRSSRGTVSSGADTLLSDLQ